MCDCACLLLSCGSDKGAEAGCQCDSFYLDPVHTHTRTCTHIYTQKNTHAHTTQRNLSAAIFSCLLCPWSGELIVSPAQLSPLLKISMEGLLHHLASIWPAEPEPIRGSQTGTEQERLWWDWPKRSTHWKAGELHCIRMETQLLRPKWDKTLAIKRAELPHRWKCSRYSFFCSLRQVRGGCIKE